MRMTDYDPAANPSPDLQPASSGWQCTRTPNKLPGLLALHAEMTGQKLNVGHRGRGLIPQPGSWEQDSNAGARGAACSLMLRTGLVQTCIAGFTSTAPAGGSSQLFTRGEA